MVFGLVWVLLAWILLGWFGCLGGVGVGGFIGSSGHSCDVTCWCGFDAARVGFRVDVRRGGLVLVVLRMQGSLVHGLSFLFVSLFRCGF